MTEHTPTPWHRNIPPASKYPTIFSGRNTHVVQVVTRGLSEDEIEANCVFIVEAVNNHQALKARVKELEATLECVDQCIASTSMSQIGYAQKIARKALDRKGEK